MARHMLSALPPLGSTKARVADAGQRRALANAGGDAGLDRLAVDEALDVGAELRAVLGRRAGRVALRRLVDHALRHGRVHVARRRLPHQHRVAVLAVVSTVSVPQRAAPRVGAAGAQQHRARDGRHAGAQRVEYLVVGLRAVVGRPERQLVAQRRDYRVAAHGLVARRCRPRP